MVEKRGLDLIGIEYFVMVLKQNMIKKAVFCKVTLMVVHVVNYSSREWGYFHKEMVLHVDGWASQVALVAKNLPAIAGDVRDVGLIPGSGRSPGGGYSNPLQYSCLKNPMDRGTWQATVHRVAKSQTRLK